VGSRRGGVKVDASDQAVLFWATLPRISTYLLRGKTGEKNGNQIGRNGRKSSSESRCHDGLRPLGRSFGWGKKVYREVTESWGGECRGEERGGPRLVDLGAVSTPDGMTRKSTRLLFQRKKRGEEASEGTGRMKTASKHRERVSDKGEPRSVCTGSHRRILGERELQRKEAIGKSCSEEGHRRVRIGKGSAIVDLPPQLAAS